MADVVHARDQLTAGRATHPRSASKSGVQDIERKTKPPRSDLGTIILHWTTAIAFVVSLFTGIRMATFGWVLPRVSQWLEPITPQGEMIVELLEGMR